MKYALSCLFALSLISCWKLKSSYQGYGPKVWGSKPVYAAEGDAKKIIYDSRKHSIIAPGNIYAIGNFIFQVDMGRGIHVTDNRVPANATRIGFITVNGCSQVSVKGSYLYTNSYGDLVTIDISDISHIKVVSRLANTFPELEYDYPLAQPEESGYYTCPQPGSVVVGWVKDSVYTNCYKN
jgi:hypothetical protein